MQNIHAYISDVEARAKAAGVSIASICEKAGVHPTTFSRWKAGVSPSYRTIGKIDAVLDEILSPASPPSGG